MSNNPLFCYHPSETGSRAHRTFSSESLENTASAPAGSTCMQLGNNSRCLDMTLMSVHLVILLEKMGKLRIRDIQCNLLKTTDLDAGLRWVKPKPVPLMHLE
ncbi:uncharacterized protein [Callorhinus ursinus]|uniref:uncharacterized protein isoform X2 n=1 Tax=Callorhinus ursinus TaxID=34884 RepID=UPI003CD01300